MSCPPAALAVDHRGSGRRLVLVHGFTQNRACFAPHLEALAATYEVLGVDLPGHGGSRDVRVRSLEHAAELLGEAGGRATYIGYSLGGRACLQLGISHPGLVEALVLVGSSPGVADPKERQSRRQADNELAHRLRESGDLEAFLADWLAQPLFARLDERAANLEARRENTPGGLAHALDVLGVGAQDNLWPRLHELAEHAIPVLVVVGSADEKFTRIAKEMVAAIGPTAELAVVAGSGHAVPFQRPEAFLETLGRWLSDSH
jgi:2-succinyl-6-hydroxy-2,4-cyclohexadiene-1-carboxylate synthase